MKYRDIPQAIQEGSWCCNFTIRHFIERIDDWKSEGLEMNPDFQRGHVWTVGQSKRYIEALLEGRVKNANTIYLNNSEFMNSGSRNFYCVDGLQRYNAVKLFYENKLSIYNNIKLDDFEDKHILLRMLLLKINMNTLQTRKEVLQWYLEMNSGGTVHTKEELNRVKKLLKNEVK